MSIPAAHLDLFRDQWTDRLVDTCVIKEQTGTGFDPGTGQMVPTYTTHYDGACLVRPGQASDVVAGEEQAQIYAYMVFIPYTEVDIVPGWVIDVTSTHDGDLDGEQLVIQNVEKDSYLTVRKLGCEENQSAG
jgi:hypothetical protein